MKRKFAELKIKMKLKLQILIVAIIVLTVYIPAVRAQANLTFSGGSGAPLSITLRISVIYTQTAPCPNPVPIFRNVGNVFSGNPPFGATVQGSGTMIYSVNGGFSRNMTTANSGFSFNDVSTNDVIINYPSSGNDPSLPSGTVGALHAGTFTTNGNVTAAAPSNGSFTTFLICPSNLTRVSGDGVVVTTAAAISVSGRVLTDTNRGAANAVVNLTETDGTIRQARTNAFGYYRFENVEAGQTVVVSIVSKRFQFAPQIVSVTEDLTELNFTAQQ
jgi:hypothetical protein